MKRAEPTRLHSAIADLDQARRKRNQRDAETLERLARRAGLPADTAAQLALNLAPPRPNPKWTFVMLSPAQNAAVINWIDDNAARPRKSIRLWAQLFNVLRNDTGEILLTRQQLAERVGIAPREVTKIMTELEGINAIRRERDGRRVRYFMSPHVATHVPDAGARAEAQEAAPLLKLMEGGRQDD